MDAKIIEAQPREAMNGRENKRQRRLGFVPANINIKGEDSVSVLLSVAEFKRALQQHGRAAVFTLRSGKDSYSVMVRDVDSDSLTGALLNVTFQQVSVSEQIKLNLPIRLKGTDELNYKQLLVSQQTDVLAVSGLAKDIPNAIEIDVAEMESGDNLFVKDVALPEGIKIELDPEQLLLSVGRARVYAEPEAEGDAAEEASAEE